MAQQTGKILVVDEDEFSRSHYRDLLTEQGFEVFICATRGQFLQVMRSKSIDLVITDVAMPDLEAQGLLNYLSEHFPQTDVIVTTGYADVETAVKLLKAGARDYLRKPVNPEEFTLAVARCLEQKNLFQQNQEFQRYLGLFEACHRISGCLEVERLMSLSLTALVQELEAQNGFVLYRKGPDILVHSLLSGSRFDLREVAMVYSLEQTLDYFFEQREMRMVVAPVYPRYTRMTVMLPIVVQDQVPWVFFLFYSRKGNERVLVEDHISQRANFMGRQIELAYDNATKYSHARSQVFIDDLTGLYNSKYLESALEKEFKRAKRYGSSISVLFLDVDRFKLVNDTHGHLVGSRLIKEIGQVIKSCLRDIDIAVRYGGDEYTMILVNTDSGGATKVAERIRQSVESRNFLAEDGLNLKVSVCIGIASYPEHAKNVQEILDMADQAMYRGKNSTRNVVYIWNASTPGG